jgi:hypothetical protein
MDDRTRRIIDTLHPNAQAWAEAHYAAINASGLLPSSMVVKFISGHRTWAEQDELYAQGRTKPGDIVTNARGGQSNHNYGVAWDIGLFTGPTYHGEHRLYRVLGAVGKGIGLNWGGDWRKPDRPHYEVPVGLSVAQMRQLVLAGKPIPVPTFGGAPVPPPTNNILVFDGATQTNVPAFFEAGRTWVAVRRFCEVFGGSVDSASASRYTLTLNGETASFNGKNVGGVGYAKFADLNQVLEWGFTFGSGKLVIHADEA